MGDEQGFCARRGSWRSGRLRSRRAGRGLFGRRRPARLCRIWRKAGEPGGGGGGGLRRRRVLHADQAQGVAAQDVAGLGKLRRLEKVGRVAQVEHDRRVQKKARAAPDLLRQLGLKGGVAQQPRAHHHDGKNRALNEIARHPRIDAVRRPSWTGVNPKPGGPQRLSGSPLAFRRSKCPAQASSWAISASSTMPVGSAPTDC